MIATDKDTGNNARLTYRLVPSNTTRKKQCETEAELFAIMPNTGWLYLKGGSLDRETCDFHELHVLAIDNGNPPATALTQILINVLDYNDNEPKFDADHYEFDIEENQVSGFTVGSVHATDLDLDINAVMRYSLIGVNSTFDINPSTGKLNL